MIKLLQLNDFQSHQESVLEFSPGVNVITGGSDSGKSAMLRGLYWVLTNRPSGLGFIRKAVAGKKDGKARVTVVVGEKDVSTVITRTRSAKENACTCGNQPYSTLGKDVPEDVLRALNMNEINIQRQLDGPFLILSPPSAVAAKFNQYTNLDKVDQMVSELSSKVREHQQHKTYLEGDIDTCTAKIDKYSWLQDYAALVDVHENLLSEIDGLRNSANAIAEHVAVLKRTGSALRENEVELDNATQIHRTLLAALKTAQAVSAIDAEICVVKSLVDCVRAGDKRMASTDTTGLASMLPVLDALSDVSTDIAAVSKDITALMQFVFTLRGLEEKARSCDASIAELKATAAQLNAELLQFDTCPACGQKLTPEAKRQLAGEAP